MWHCHYEGVGDLQFAFFILQERPLSSFSSSAKCLFASSTFSGPYLPQISQKTENRFLQEEVSLLLQTKINPSHWWYTMLTTYSITQSQCLGGIGKEGTEESNTFARNIWNNATDKLIKRNVGRILLGFLKWRGTTEYPSTELRSASLPACLQGTLPNSSLARRNNMKTAILDLTTDPPGPAVHLWQLMRVVRSVHKILCCSCSPKMLMLNFRSFKRHPQNPTASQTGRAPEVS